jgi:hypothetical protein
LKHSSATIVSNVAQVKPLEKLRDQQSGAINAEISAGCRCAQSGSMGAMQRKLVPAS